MKRVKKQKQSIPEVNGKIKTATPSPFVSMNNILKKIEQAIINEGIFNIGILLLSSMLFLFFSLSHLGKHIYTDEPVLWYPWISNFGEALQSFDFSSIKKPYNYPGMPVIGLGSILTSGMKPSLIPAEEFHNYLFLMKSPIVVFNFFSLFIIYIFVKKIWNKETALLTTVLISLHPLIITFSQHTQGDSTLWNTFIITLLSFFLYLKSNKKRYILITAFFFALTVLSKFFGLILYPLLFIFLYSEYIFKNISREQFTKSITGLFTIYALLLLFVFILYPLTWDNPGLVLKTTFTNRTINVINPYFPLFVILLIAEVVFLKGKVSQYIRNKKSLNIIFYITMGVFFINIIYGIFSKYTDIFTGKGRIYFGGVKVKDYLTTINQFTESLNYIIPWYVFLGILAIIVYSFIKKKNFTQKNYIIYIIFIIFSFAGSAVVGHYQIWGKYLLFLVPLIFLGFAILFTDRFKSQKILTPLILIIAVVEIISVFPTYFSYKNNFLPFQNSNIYDGNYGGYEIAQKANNLKEAHKLRVLSDTYGFMYFFKGKNELINANTTEKQLLNFDYAFLSSFGKTEKTAWNMVPYSLRILYDKPLDSAKFYLGNDKQFVKLIKIPTSKYKYVPNNYFDTDFYINFSRNRSISFWVMPSDTDTLTSIISIARSKQDQLFIKSQRNKIITIYNDKNINEVEILTDRMTHIVWINKKTKTGYERLLFVNGQKAANTKHNYLGETIKGIFINTQYPGIIQDIRIYGDELNYNKIQAIYNSGIITNERILIADEEEFAPIRHYTKK